MSVIVYRLEDGSQWQGELSFEEADERYFLSWLSAHKAARPSHDPDWTLWIAARGPLYREGWDRYITHLRPSAIVAFHVTPE